MIIIDFFFQLHHSENYFIFTPICFTETKYVASYFPCKKINISTNSAFSSNGAYLLKMHSNESFERYYSEFSIERMKIFII